MSVFAVWLETLVSASGYKVGVSSSKTGLGGVTEISMNDNYPGDSLGHAAFHGINIASVDIELPNCSLGPTPHCITPFAHYIYQYCITGVSILFSITTK